MTHTKRLLVVICMLAVVRIATADTTAVVPHSMVASLMSNHKDDPKRAGIKDEVLITVASPQHLLNDAQQIPSNIVLYIEGMAVPGIPAPWIEMSPDSSTGTFTFVLTSNDSTCAFFNKLIAARGANEFFETQTVVSIGTLTTLPLPPQVRGTRAFTIVLFSSMLFYTCVVAFIVLIIIFFFVARSSDILRDSTDPAPVAPKRKPYSLARSQMALWFFLIMGAFMLLWTMTGRTDTIQISLVALMGISAATGLGALMIDNNDSNTAAAAAYSSEGFFRDILSNNGSISLHRFQIFGWTLVLGIVFIVSVFRNLAMPEFNSTLLILMGVSSGTYLGYKVKE